MMTRRTNRIWITVGVAGAVALLFLAWLQHSWITQVSDAERDRLRTHVADDLRKLTDEFDTTISRSVRAILAGPPDLDAFTERYMRWAESSSDSPMVKTVYKVEGADFFAFNPREHRMTKQAWPPQLSELRQKLDDSLNLRPPRTLVIESNIPIIAVARPPMMQGFGPMGPPRGDGLEGLQSFRGFRPPFQRRGSPSWLIIELDRDNLTRQILPALIGHHLDEGGQSPYVVRIQANNDSRNTIYTNAASDVSFVEPDAAAPMFDVRMAPGTPMEMRRPPPSGTGGGGPGPGAWLVEVKHRAGSLELAVAGTRHANLAISFATLLIMGAALIIVLITTRRAQSLAHAQMEFVAGVSHELRTPLSVICSAADNLADGVITNEQGIRRYGTVIRAEGRRLAAMVEQILRFAGIQSGRANYELQTTAIGSVVERAVAACQPDIEKAHCAVETNLAPELPTVQADPTALVHAFRNLIDNAIVHAASGHWVGISACGRNGSVEIRVMDHGPGIPARERARIFDPFVRGRRATDDQIHGFGLGLALVKRIVEAHEGTVSCDTGERGATFTVTLPAAKS